MSNEDDVFLKTFTQMIDVLKTIHLTIDSLKKSVEIIQMSIDGLGTGLTNANTNLTEINSKFDSLSKKLEKSTTARPTQVEKKIEKELVKAKSKSVKKGATPVVEASPVSIQPSAAEHPIFVNLNNKINGATSYKEVGDLLIEALEQIESSFSFSRVFYEIRRIGNSLIRKGEKDIPPGDKMEILEKLIDWEKRLVE